MALPRNKVFWNCLGAGVLFVCLALTYRIVMGAEFKAETKEVSISLTEGAKQLEEGTKLLAAENERLKKQAAEFEERLKEAIAKAEAACPKADPPKFGKFPIYEPLSSQKLDEIMKRASGARQAAEKVEKLGAGFLVPGGQLLEGRK